MKNPFSTQANIRMTCTFILVCLSLVPAVKAQSLLFANSFPNSVPQGGALEGRGIALDGAGNRYVTGSFQNTADLDPGAGTQNLNSTGGYDIFLAKYDASGNYVWAQRIGNTGTDQAYALAIDASGNSYITGSFSGTVDFDPGAATQMLTAAGNTDIFLAKYDASGNYVWAKAMGSTAADAGAALVIDASGNSYITGYFGGTADLDPGAGTQNLISAGSNDIFLAKYDASGNYVWANRIGSTTSDQGFALTIDASGNSFIAGTFSGTADFDPGAGTQNLISAGNGDIYLAKYDASGNYTWAKRIGGGSSDIAYAIAVDASGNSHITGTFLGTVDFDPGAGTQNLVASANFDMFLAKYDASGNYVWAKNVGGTSNDFGYALALDASANCYVTGYFSFTADFDPGAGTQSLSSVSNTPDIYVAKYNSSGNYVWAKGIGGTGTELGYALTLDASGNTYSTGYFQHTIDFDPGAGTASLTAGATVVNGYMLQLNSAGDYVSAKLLGGLTGDALIDAGAVVKVDASGNIYTTGAFNGTVDFDPGPGTQFLTSAGVTDMYLAKYDASGNYVWAKNIGSTSYDYGIDLGFDASGNCYVTGHFMGTVDFDPGTGTQNLTSAGNNDVFLAKYDASGNYIWAKSMGGADNSQPTSLVIDASGNSYISGYFYVTADFDPGAGTQTLTAAGNSDIFLARYDASGNYIWAKNMGGLNAELTYSLAVDATGNSYITGRFTGTSDFDPGAGTQNLTAAGDDIFLAKYDAAGNYVWAKGIGGASVDQGQAVAIDASGNCYITGYFMGTVDFDPGAGTQNLTSNGSADIFLAKYDASGNYVWAKSIGGTGSDVGRGLAIDASGNCYVTGWFSNSVDFDPGTGTQILSSAGLADVFLAQYDASGNYVWAKNMGGFNDDNSFNVTVDAAGNSYITGQFLNTADFDPDAGTLNLVSLNSFDIFLAKYGPNGTLAVRLESFAGQLVDNGKAVLLQWTSAAEEDHAYFEVERSNGDDNFTKVGRVTGCGTCNSRRPYSFKDHEPLTGKSYYRLGMVNKDGITAYSKWISINKHENGGSLALYPTITANRAVAYYDLTGTARKIRVSIFTMEGKVVQQKQQLFVIGRNQLNIDLTEQIPGMYYVQLAEQHGKILATGTVIRQ